jgi:hypothetical protein
MVSTASDVLILISTVLFPVVFKLNLEIISEINFPFENLTRYNAT